MLGRFSVSRKHAFEESESAKIEKSTIFKCETKTKCDKIEYNTVEIKGQL